LTGQTTSDRDYRPRRRPADTPVAITLPRRRFAHARDRDYRPRRRPADSPDRDHRSRGSVALATWLLCVTSMSMIYVLSVMATAIVIQFFSGSSSLVEKYFDEGRRTLTI